jgi:AcrR family transcriptional regulator
MSEAAEVLAQPALGAVERLVAFLAGSRRLKIAAAPLVRRTLSVLFRPENASLRQRVTAATIARVAPVLATILEQGRREGVIDTPDPLGTAELLLHLGTATHDTIARALTTADAGSLDEAAEMLDGRLRLVEQAFNRVLALPDGTVSLTEPGFAAAVLRADSVAP